MNTIYTDAIARLGGLLQNERSELYETMIDALHRLQAFNYYSRLALSASDLEDLLIELLDSVFTHIGSEHPLFLDERWFLLTLKRARAARVVNEELIQELAANPPNDDLTAATLSAILNLKLLEPSRRIEAIRVINQLESEQVDELQTRLNEG